MSKKQQGMTAKSFNKTLYIMSGCILVVTIAVGIYFGISLEKTSREVSKNKYIDINNSKKIEALAQLSTDYKQIDREMFFIDSYIPDEKKISAILKDLEIMAKSNSLSFTAYKTIEGGNKSSVRTEDIQIKKKDDYYVFPFQIELEGSFLGINSMLVEIESFDRLIDIKALSYEKSEAAASVTTDGIKANLLVNVYLIK